MAPPVPELIYTLSFKEMASLWAIYAKLVLWTDALGTNSHCLSSLWTVPLGPVRSLELPGNKFNTGDCLPLNQVLQKDPSVL
jgi:hypothetical protein